MMLVAQVFVLKCTPVCDEQTVRVVLCPWYILNLSNGNDGTFKITAASLYELSAEIFELSLFLAKLN